jgi:dihydrofolate synthase/folylpolyglutamate synthase
MAFQYYKEMQPDYCIIETGLGGRLDSTNVLNPLAVVITTISLEHTNVLGDTIEQIAAEKAAIIKNDSKVFTGILNQKASEIIIRKCKETKSQHFQLKDYISNDVEDLSIFPNNFSLHLNPPLKGRYQKINSALAALAVSKTFSFYDEQKYLDGIANVVKNTGLQGRYEYYHKNPTIIFDSAHNPEGVEKFLGEFANEAASYKKKTLLFGVMRDKAIGEMLQMLSEYFDEILLTDLEYERSAKVEEINELCKQLGIAVRPIKGHTKFVQSFMTKNRGECLVILGSMYLLGEIKQQLLAGVT